MCDVCENEYSRDDYLQRHKMNVHENWTRVAWLADDYQLLCEFCFCRFKTIDLFVAHQRREHYFDPDKKTEKIAYCNESTCTESFTSDEILKEHKMVKHRSKDSKKLVLPFFSCIHVILMLQMVGFATRVKSRSRTLTV